MPPDWLAIIPQLVIAAVGLLIRRELSRMDAALIALAAAATRDHDRLTWLEAAYSTTRPTPHHPAADRHPAGPCSPAHP